jgi:subtilase family serine protease
MSHPSRRFVSPTLAAALVTALGGSLLTGPFWSVAQAAEARVVVARTTTLPGSATIVSRPITTDFDVALTLRDPSGLESFLSGLTNERSPLYRHFLTPSQFASRFGASPSTITTVRHYLENYGLHVRLLNAGRTLLEMSGRTSEIARAFATPVQTVHLTNGTLRARFARSATLPASIAHDVTAVVGLSSVVSPTPKLLATHSVHSKVVALPGTCPSAQSSNNNSPNILGGYSVQQQAALYGLTSAWSAGKTGVGQTIAVYELGQYDATDAANFYSCYGLSPSVTAINVDGGTTGGFSDEATMDVEATAALAPGAALEVYQAPNNSTGPVDLYSRIASDDTATIISTSWGDCELDPTGSVSSEQVLFEQMAAQGQTVIAAAGDNGSSDCTGIVSNAPAVDDPASQPFVTGVGGLSVTSIANPLTETVWNANGGAGGGGVSQIWSRPTWQNAPGISATETMRLVPDLSVMADPSTGFMQNFTGKTTASLTDWSSIGGTSIGAPLVSSLVAVAAQVCGIARLGFINPTLYNLARTSKGFVDVTTGSNDLFGTGVYPAGVGYDMASGIGSPDVTFVDDLCPSAVSPKASALVSFTKNSVVATNSHLTVALRDANGNPVVDSSVALIAHASSGRILFDSDPASARATGHALYSVSSDTNGYASFTLSTTEPGPVTLTVKLNGAVLYTTTVIFHPLPLARQKPIEPRITRVTARSKGAVVSVAPRRPSNPFVEALQVSLDGGRTWHSYPGRSTSIVLTDLKSRTVYVIRLRAKNGNGYSPVSHAVRVTTLR